MGAVTFRCTVGGREMERWDYWLTAPWSRSGESVCQWLINISSCIPWQSDRCTFFVFTWFFSHFNWQNVVKLHDPLFHVWVQLKVDCFGWDIVIFKCSFGCFPSVERRATEWDVWAQTAGGPAGGEEAENAEEELLGPEAEPPGPGSGQYHNTSHGVEISFFLLVSVHKSSNSLMCGVCCCFELMSAQAPSEDGAKATVSNSSGYTLVRDPPGPSGNPGCRLDRPASPSSQMPILNGLEAVSVESDEEEEEDDMSMDSLLKRSRECVKKAQSQQGSGVPAASRSLTPQPDSDKEKKRSGAVVQFGFSLQHSPVGLPQSPPQHQTLGDSTPQQPDHYTHLLSFENSSSPRRRRPRPVSTGNIHISFPIGPADLIPRNPGWSGLGVGVTEPSLGATELSASEDMGGVNRSGNCFPNHSGASPKPETFIPICASASGPKERPDHLVPGFRRRCHTLDSQIRNPHSRAEHVDRSQERVPRFMAGVTWMPPSRRSPAAALSQTYKVENPSPSLLRPHTTPDVSQLQDSKTGWAFLPRFFL